MRSALTAVLPLLALCACERQPPSASVKPAAVPPPAAVDDRYVGRWAASEALCADGAWVFEARKLATAGEVSCAFDTVAPTASGYDIAATCIAQAPPQPGRLSLTFAESARAMIVEGGPFAGPVGLIRCGPPPSAQP